MMKCTLNKFHRWDWVKDKVLTTFPSPTTRCVQLRGIYRCACGAAKYGMPRGGLGDMK